MGRALRGWVVTEVRSSEAGRSASSSRRRRRWRRIALTVGHSPHSSLSSAQIQTFGTLIRPVCVPVSPVQRKDLPATLFGLSGQQG